MEEGKWKYARRSHSMCRGADLAKQREGLRGRRSSPLWLEHKLGGRGWEKDSPRSRFGPTHEGKERGSFGGRHKEAL